MFGLSQQQFLRILDGRRFEKFTLTPEEQEEFSRERDYVDSMREANPEYEHGHVDTDTFWGRIAKKYNLDPESIGPVDEATDEDPHWNQFMAVRLTEEDNG